MVLEEIDFTRDLGELQRLAGPDGPLPDGAPQPSCTTTGWTEKAPPVDG